MYIRPEFLNAFSLSSAALGFAHEEFSQVYGDWRDLLKRLDVIRGRHDPFADQNANLDVLLRSFEKQQQERRRAGDDMSGDTSGLQLQVHLSRLWVVGAYEFLRSLHQKAKTPQHPLGQCLTRTNSKGCGKLDCELCTIGHLKNDLAVVRIGIAKHQVARDIANPPLPASSIDGIRSLLSPDEPPQMENLLPDEGMWDDSAMAWYKVDTRVQQKRLFTRLSLSNSILAWPEYKPEAASISV